MIKYICYLAIVFTVLLTVAYLHYWINPDMESFYYLFFYGWGGLALGSLLLLRWVNVMSPADLLRKYNENPNAEKEDQDSLKYGSMVMSASMVLIGVSLSMLG